MPENGMIRLIKPSDLEKIAALESQLFYKGLDLASLQTLFAGPSFKGFVYGKSPSAYLLAHVTQEDAEILSIGTVPAQQRQGMAGALCQHLVTLLSAARKTALFLEVAADNDAAISLYQKNGFLQIATRKAYYRRQV